MAQPTTANALHLTPWICDSAIILSEKDTILLDLCFSETTREYPSYNYSALFGD